MVVIAFAVAAVAQILWAPPQAGRHHTATRLGDAVVYVGPSTPLALTGDAWSDLPTPLLQREDHAAAALGDGTLLVAGGRVGETPTASVEIYVPSLRLWRSANPLPAPLSRAASAELDGGLILVGGDTLSGPTRDVWLYHPDIPYWRRGPSLPEPRSGHRVVVDARDRVWVVGGESSGSSVLRWDPTASSDWTALPTLPVRGLTGHVALALGDDVAVIGGRSEGGEVLAATWRWDETLRDWREQTPMAHRRADHAAALLDSDGILVVGGTTGPAAPELFYPEARAWSEAPAPTTSRRFASLVVSGGDVLLSGGLAPDGSAPTATERYRIASGTWRPTAPPTPMDKLGLGMIETSKSAVTLALTLVGVMTLFLGLMKVAEAGGLLTILAKLIRPVMIKLFPGVPADHPAMGAMIMNMAANVMGLGNAATPFGIRAMQELDKLNPHKGTSTNAMALFLAINTSSVTLLPTGVIGIRAAVGSSDPAGILYSTLFATICSTSVAILAAKTYQRFAPLPKTPEGVEVEVEAFEAPQEEPSPDETEPLPEMSSASYPLWVSALALGAVFSILPLALVAPSIVDGAAKWIIPGLMLGLLSFGFVRGVSVYEAFVNGAKDGFQVAVTIIPYLVGILVAVGMFRESGALGFLIGAIGPATTAFGLPPEALPMALLRPLSGSGAIGIMTSIIQDPAVGPDSYVGYLVSTINGSTETTFYVIAVYFGAIRVRRIRHAMAAALTADIAGVIAAVIICSWFFGNL